MFTKAFWKGAGERAVKTFAQSALGSIIVGTTVTGIDWGTVAGIAVTATIVSLLTSLATPGFVAGTDKESAA